MAKKQTELDLSVEVTFKDGSQTIFNTLEDASNATGLSINALKREVTICLASYFSKEIRDNGGQPIETIDINVPSEDYDLFLEGNIYQVSYCWLKENVIGFEEAADI